MISYPSRLWRYTVCVFCVGLAVQAACIVWLRPAWQRTGWTNFAIEDAWMYRGMADLFREHGLLYDGEDIAVGVRNRTPGYPVWILAMDEVAAVTGWSSPGLLTLSNAVFYALACALVVRLTAAWTGEVAGLAAGLIFTVTPAVPFSLAHMPESLATALWLGSLLLLLRGLRRAKPAALLLAGLLGALASLTKPVFLYYEAICILLILTERAVPLRRRLAYGGLHALAYVLTIAPWYARNWTLWHVIVFSPLSGSLPYQHVRPLLLEDLGLPVWDPTQHLNYGFADERVPRTVEAWQERFGSSWYNLARRHEVLGRLAFEDFANHPAAFVWLVVRRQARLYVNTSPQSLAQMADPEHPPPPGSPTPAQSLDWLWGSGWWRYQVVTWALLGLTYLAAAVGLIRAWRQRRFQFLAWSGLTLLYLAALTGTNLHSRYRFPMMPVFAGLAGLGIATALAHLRAQRGRGPTLAGKEPQAACRS